jgi:hypothetical protein
VTPEETARAVKPAVVGLGAAFGHEPSFAEHGARLGLDRWAFYFGGRAGVLGPVGFEVVAAACGFFAPDLVRPAWSAVLDGGRLDEVVETDVALCVAWAREHLGAAADAAPAEHVSDGRPHAAANAAAVARAAANAAAVARAAALTERAVEAADAAGRVLFAAWRALPDPADDAAAVLGLNLLRLREHRGGSHLLAVEAEGLTPLEAILAGPGERKAVANGWRGPFPDAPDPARLEAAERCTDRLAGAPYAALSDEEREELVELLGRFR